MTQIVTLRHRTLYRFNHPVRLGPHTIRLHPSPTNRTSLLSYDLRLQPDPLTLHWFFDPMANRVARASFSAETESLAIDVTAVLALTPYNPFDFVVDADAASWPIAYPEPIARELAPYMNPPPVAPWVATLFAGLELTPQPSVNLLVRLNQHVCDLNQYITRLEAGVQDPAVTVERRSGSCRDVAWLMVLGIRALGFAARFVSGYLIQLVDPAAPTPGLDADRADLHAWVEVYLPGAGWIGLDATSGMINGPGHVGLATGARPDAAAPVDGTTSSAIAELETVMTVERQNA